MNFTLCGIELGGTKTVLGIGDASGQVIEEMRFPTSDPATTLGKAVDWLRERGTPRSIGIAAFGPIVLDPNHPQYGCLLDTPKPQWKGTNVLEPFSRAFPDARLVIDTDVNAAALAESYAGGAADGMENLVYITVGTGIGAGIRSGGMLIHGALHPEFGHIKLPRAPGDQDFPGVCPFHGDCLEGMASGPAMSQRWGRDAAGLPADHPAWDTEAWYLAHAVMTLTAVVSPQRVIIGGGVSQAAGFHDKIETRLRSLAGGYFPQIAKVGGYVVPPALGQQAGMRGALLLGSEA